MPSLAVPVGESVGVSHVTHEGVSMSAARLAIPRRGGSVATGAGLRADPTDGPRFRRLLEDRRVAVGGGVALHFENRDTLRFRLQELGRVARLTSAADVRPELDWYARLLPARGTLRAALWLGEAGRRATREALAQRHSVTAGVVAFVDAGGRAVPGRFRADRVRDRRVGLAGWVEFAFAADDRAAFVTPGRGWHLVVEAGGVRSASEVLADGVWRSLCADLR